MPPPLPTCTCDAHNTHSHTHVYTYTLSFLAWCDGSSTNVEGVASLAADRFYSDQPELALLLYRRLLQMGVSNAEL